MIALGFRTSAEFSPDCKYRYFLSRDWYPPDGRIVFVMLNPSTADEFKNDPTVERCQRRAMKMGFGGLSVVNIFAWRSTDPSVLSKLEDPIGPDNDTWIKRAVSEAKLVVCAWGKGGAILGRGRMVLDLVRQTGAVSHALKINDDGSPAHPLYLSYDLIPTPIEGK